MKTIANPIAYPSHFHNFNKMQASKAQKPFKMVPFSSIFFANEGSFNHLSNEFGH